MRFQGGAFALYLTFTVNTVQAAVSTFSQSLCITKQGRTLVQPVPTATQARTVTLPALARVTSTPTVIITPPPVTLTSRVFITSTSTKTITKGTSTFTSTSTFFDTSTITDYDFTTTLLTSFSTSTVAPVTSTIPASAGFTPLGSAPAADGYTWSKKRKREDGSFADKRRGDILIERAQPAAPAQQTVLFGPTPTYKPPLYPSKVECLQLVEVVSTTTSTVTAPKAVTSTAKPSKTTKTVTSVVVLTTTTLIPRASTTVTVSTTSTVTTGTLVTITGTFTTTATTTTTVPTATTYAACQADNLVSRVQGFPIIGIEPAINGVTDQTRVDNPYDCCVACVQRGSNCSGSAFSNNEFNNCFLIESAENTAGSPTCNAANSAGGFFSGPSIGFTGVLSNSNCGQWEYLADD